MNKAETVERVRGVILRFLESNERECPPLGNDCELHQQAGLSSDEGVCIVLELSAEFGVTIPNDFNAVVHQSGQRSRTLDELADCIIAFAEAA